jgi:peptidoglycan/LPS O-acetylase OafA/YrhL
VYNKLFGLNTDWISGVYWSLFVEVKFYFLAAVVYFLSPRQFLVNFFWLMLALCTVYWVAVIADISIVQNVLALAFFPKYAFLFVAGMAFNELHNRAGSYSAVSVGMVLFSLAYSMAIYSPINPVQAGELFAMVMILMFFVLFVLFVADAKILLPLKSAALAKVGAASYSLYLLHEAIGVSAINALDERFVSSALWPFVAIVLVVIMSIVFYDRLETPARRLIRKAYATHVKSRLEVQAANSKD